jgi:hypothetical protein
LTRIARRCGLLPALLLILLPGCDRSGRTPGPAGPGSASAAPAAGFRFARVTEAAGIRFRHETGATGKKYFPEFIGAGCAFLDYDNDGHLDAFLVNGGPLPASNGDDGAETPGDRLFRGSGDGTFTDVTRKAGITTRHYGVACCAGDYDDDGFLDLLVTGFGGCILYRNNRNGTFTDVTAKAGVGMNGFCSGAAFGDYDGDGRLDLYVCRYVRYDLAHNIPCYQNRGTERRLIVCPQTTYDAALHALFRNNGDGTFTDVSAKSGIGAVQPGRGLGVLFTDFDEDGRQDIFVANDLTPNFLFHNLGNGRFKDEALERGAAYSIAGAAQAGMGVASADVDRDGLIDLLSTHFSREYTTLYRQDQEHTFRDVAAPTGLAEATRSYVGFGVSLEDFDRDGWLDLLIANGHVSESAVEFYEGTTLAQPKVVLHGVEGRRFEPVASPWADAEAGMPRIGRGTAAGDFDEDGDVDVLVNNAGDRPDLLRNDTSPAGHWIAVRLSQDGRNRFAVGARVTVWSGGKPQAREVRWGASYGSQDALALLYGLGPQTAGERIEVRWPGGPTETWTAVAGDRLHVLKKGTGTKG